ncbi:hypothetical protein Q5752_007011 [Cryptotrichosporon argae]
MIVCNLCGTAVSANGVPCGQCSGSGVARSTHLRGLLTPSQQKGSPDRWAKRYTTPPSTPPKGEPSPGLGRSTGAAPSPLSRPTLGRQDTLDIATGPDNAELARVYGSVLSPSIQHPTCARCDAALTLGAKLYLAKRNVRTILAGDSLCRSCFASMFALGVCSLCGKPVVGDTEEGYGGQHVTGRMNRIWHAACFNCTECGDTLYPPGDTDHEVRPTGQPVCATCAGTRDPSVATPTSARLSLPPPSPRLNLNSRFPLPGQTRRQLQPIAIVNREFAAKRWNPDIEAGPTFTKKPMSPTSSPTKASGGPGMSVRDRIAKLNAANDGKQTIFHSQYLFDHCRCRRCFHPQTKQRLKLVPLASTRALDVRAEHDGLKVSWTPDHVSHFPYTFLEKAAYDPPLVHPSADERILWNSKIARTPPTVDYASIMAADPAVTDRAVLRWLDKIHDFGFCFVSGVPPTPEDTEALIKRVGNIRHTHYGGFWDFTADMSLGDLAYSSQALPAHTDTTYFTDPAGLQVFHLLQTGNGGTTLLVDGFYTASLLNQLHPTAYSTLSRLRVPYHASGTPGSLLRPPISQPVFRHDERGNLVQVRWNNEDRGVIGAGWKADDVRAWYDAAKQYQDLLQNEDAEYWVQLTPGTVVVIDNWRVMHGRSEFTGQRRMCGAYVGADDWKSRRAALASQLRTEDVWQIGW